MLQEKQQFKKCKIVWRKNIERLKFKTNLCSANERWKSVVFPLIPSNKNHRIEVKFTCGSFVASHTKLQT